MIEPLVASIASRDVISEAEVDALRQLVGPGREFAVGEDIVVEGSRPKHSTLLLNGIAGRYRVLGNGKRQITALHVDGDFIDLHAFMLKTMDHGVIALSPCTVAFAPHAELKLISENEPHLTRLLWLLTVIDAAIHREWIVAMGRRSKKAALAHLFCELYVRLEIAGQVRDRSFPFPLTQSELADVLGISLVHLNKTLQGLRSDGTVRWSDRIVTILDWDALARMAEFNSDYLNLMCEPR